MPSTYPSGTWLVRHQVSASSTLLSGTSLSHTSGVSSAKADRVVPRKEKPIVADDLNIPAIIWYLVCGYVICALMYNYILYLTPLILHLSFALECIQFHEDYVSWHELHGICCPVIVTFLPAHFAVGLEVCFSISLFEILSHFFNISWDVVGAHMGAHCWKVEIDWETWASPKHQIML